MVESSDEMLSTGEGNGKPLLYSCLENPVNSIKRQKDRTLKDELSRSVNKIAWKLENASDKSNLQQKLGYNLG